MNDRSMTSTSQQQKLIEQIGVRLETRLQIAPLAARIYALLSLSSYEGLSFEAIRQNIGASKSSTSVNLKVLKQLKLIDYYTKAGDRKRYFRIVKYFQLSSLKSFHEALENEFELVEKINAFNKLHHPEKFKNEKSLGDIAQDYLRRMQSLVTETIEKIENYKNSDSE